MSLVRRGERPYYYESFRKDGRVTSRYVGCGGLAEACAGFAARGRVLNARQWATHRRKTAALDARLRDHLARVRETWLSDREAAGAADALLAEWYERVEAIFRGAMALAGYYRHKRQWRRRRMNAQGRAAAEREFGEFWARVADGDPSVLTLVKGMFGSAAGGEMIEVFGGDLAASVVEGYTDRVAGKNLFQREAVARKLAKVRADLAGPDPSPPVRLLAERAAVSWLGAYEADLTALRWDAFAGERSADYFERRRDRAHRRYLQAVKALEVVRRLAVPVKRPQVSFGGRLAGVVGAGRD